MAKNGLNPPPEIEVQLQDLQREFLKEGSPKSVRDDFFMTLRIYARSITLKEIKRKGVILPPERVDEVCTDATLLLLRQYEKEGWEVKASFAGALRWKVIEALYGGADEEQNYSLNRTFSDDVNSKEILDAIDNSDTPWSNSGSVSFRNPLEQIVTTTNVASSEINSLIDVVYETAPYRLFMRFLPWLLIQFRKPKSRNASQMFANYYLNSKEEELFDYFLMVLRNKLVNAAYGKADDEFILDSYR